MSDPAAPATYPADYVPRFTKDEVLLRIKHLAGRLFRFKQAIEARHSGWKIEIDPVVVIDVAKSAMDDIWRYKAYHLRDRNKRADSIKRAAYFTKWIVRLRPLSVNRSLEEKDFEKNFDTENDWTLMLNESFALFFALNTIAGECGLKQILLAPQLVGNLLYDLHYRHMTDDSITELYSVIRECARKNPIVVE